MACNFVMILLNKPDLSNPKLPLKQLGLTHLFCLIALTMIFIPSLRTLCNSIDAATFHWINRHLEKATFEWQWFWGLLNHPLEPKLNLILALLLNIIGYFTCHRSQRRGYFFYMIYFWILFQIGFSLHRWMFTAAYPLRRASPSLALEATQRLSHWINWPIVKDVSLDCFPSGHAFAMGYWALFTAFVLPRRYRWISYGIAIFFSLPRLVSGAHWLSDILVAYLLAFFWFSWTLLFWSAGINAISRWPILPRPRQPLRSKTE